MKTSALKVMFGRVLFGLAIGAVVCLGIPQSAIGVDTDEVMLNVNKLPEKLKQATNEYVDKVKESARKLGEDIVAEANAMAAAIETAAGEKAQEIIDAAKKQADEKIKAENDKRAKNKQPPLTEAEEKAIRDPIVNPAIARAEALIAEAKRFADEIREKAQATKAAIDTMSAQLDADIAKVWASKPDDIGQKIENVLNLLVDFERKVMEGVKELAEDISKISTTNTDLKTIVDNSGFKDLDDKIDKLNEKFAEDCEAAQKKYDKAIKDGLGGGDFTDLGDKINEEIKKAQDKINEQMDNMGNDDDDSVPDEGSGASGHNTIDLCEFLKEVLSGGGGDGSGGSGGVGDLVDAATGWILDKMQEIGKKITDMTGASGGGLSDSLRSKINSVSDTLGKLSSQGGGLADGLNLPAGKDTEDNGASGQSGAKGGNTWRTRLN